MKRIWNFITGLKNAVGNLIFLAIVIVIVVAVVQQEGPSVPDTAVLILDPEGVLVEQERVIDPFEQLLAGDQQAGETLVKDVTDAIDFAAGDDRIKAIALDLSKLQGGALSQYEAIGASLDSFRDSGKSVYAFARGYNQSQYYLAAHADRVYLDRDAHTFLGGVFLQGLASYPLYMKSALDKLHVNIHIFKAGLFKDAVDPFIRDEMSERSRESMQALLNSLWQNYVQTVAGRRNLEPAALTDYINNYDQLLESAGGDGASLALDKGLVDARISRGEWREEMQAISGKSGDSYHHVTLQPYLAAKRPPIPVNNPARDKVAVIVAKGTILDGEQPPGDVGGDTVAALIRQARNDSTVKAVVLRVDSPGGSAAASELIRSELQVTQESGIPVVASMGGYAASGGYWIASTANRIFASATTITGSIGVFALFPTLEDSVAQLGINSDGVGTTALSGSFNQFEAINPVLQRTLQLSVDHTYRKFLSLVSEGRGLSLEEADAVAQGRVWSGDDALGHGLVDAIGGLEDAIASAATLADISDYDVVYIEKPLSPREQLLRQLMESAMVLMPSSTGITSMVDLVPAELRTLSTIVRQPGLYLQCVQCRVSF